MKVDVLVATHKEYRMPTDSIYLPVFVGKELHPESTLPFQGDNLGDNISSKNPHYNELTAIYWGWKNLDDDAMGLVHYRRHFMSKHSKNFNDILSGKEIESLLHDYDVLVPTKRRYWIESNRSQYLHAHEKEPFYVMERIIRSEYPEYVNAWETVMKRTWGHMFNMFIMKRKPLNEFCEWMFEVLEKVECETDLTGYNSYEQRVYGFLSEHMLDVWLEVHSEYKVKEIRYSFMEPVNWLVKGGNFLKRKFIGRK